ncbi:hypothetical protein [Candidatus Hodarchaeum mangrovi]
MKDYLLKASNALTQLNNTVSINARSMADVVLKIYTEFEEYRYIAETIPDFIIRPDNTKSNLKASGEIRVAQLLTSILCDRITELSLKLCESLEFREEEVDVKLEIREIKDQVFRLGEVIHVQQKLADGAPVSTEAIQDLSKRYEARIIQLEQELLKKEGRALTITALDAVKKPKIFGKEKFKSSLGDLILSFGKNLRASSGGYISLANLYAALKEQVPDINFSTKDLEEVCKILAKQDLISGLTKRSGVKIVEFIPVNLGEDAKKIFSLASKKGFVTYEEVILGTKWDQQRVDRVLESLVNQKIARKVSSLDSGDQYFFPGLYGEDNW